jgi:hypothetical protein
MNYNKDLLIAIRALPMEYVSDGIQLLQYPNLIMCVHDELPTISIKKGEFHWRETPDDAA